MEDILGKIMKDASSTKHVAVKQSCLESQVLLADQENLMRSPPFEIRQKCLETFRLALETKHGKLMSHACSGFQRMVWDKSFQSVFESGKEENWFPNQFLRAVQSLPFLSDDVQIELLKILLNMTSTHGQSMSSSSVISLIGLSLEAYCNSSSAAVKTAAQATINQTLTSFCIMLQETAPEEESEDSDEESYNLLETVVEDLYPILHYTCDILKSGKSTHRKVGSPLILQCILSVLKNIKIEIHENVKLINFLWQELCPLLISFLGSPKTDKKIISSQKSCENVEIGRGSGCLATAPSCHSAEAKSIYSIAVELVHLVGSVGSMRPVLESLFHRMLLYPSVQHRLEALKAVKEIMSKPELLLDLSAPPLYATSDKDWISLDLDLIKICIDALGECCHSSNKNICYSSVSCILLLLKSLEEICSGGKMKKELVACINTQFMTLESSDYKGAKSERCLKTKLRNLIEEKKKQDASSDTSTENSLDNEDMPNKIILDHNVSFSPGHKNQISSELFEMESKEGVTFPFETVEDVKHPSENEMDVENSAESINITENSTENGDNLKNPTEVLKETKNSAKNVEGVRNSIESTKDDEYSEEDMCNRCLVEEVRNENLKVVTEASENLSNQDEEIVDDVNEMTKCDLKLDMSSVENNNLEDVVSPTTESAEDALNYVSSDSSDELDEFVELNDLERLKKVPKTLLGQEDAGKEERERIEKLCLARLEFALQERENSRTFVKILQEFLPHLLAIRSSIEADQALQEFSSKYCKNLWQDQQNLKLSGEDMMSHMTILNADGIYLALYSALLLNLKLIRNGYYKDSSNVIPLTEQQFIEEVHGSGVLVYLSATWLAELYQQVLTINLLEQAGYKPSSMENYAIVNLLSGLLLGIDDWWNKNVSDVDGLGNSLPGGQQLADFKRLERTIASSHSTPEVKAGLKFCRRMLTCCWETVLEVLSVLLNGTNSCGISSAIGFLLGAKEENRKTKDAITESLDGLQRAAKLCNILGLQGNCSTVFAQLAMASLTEETLFAQPAKNIKRSLMPGRGKSLRLHESQVLSMDVILNKGLELGSHSPDCWKYVFQCCLFVLQLENTYFSGHGTIQTRSVLQSIHQGDGSWTSSNDLCKLDVSEIIQRNRGFAHSSGVIKDHQLLEVIEALSQQVDKLFEEAASRLNLSALISFLVELCAASQTQLFMQNYAKFLSTSCGGGGSNLLLYHLGDVMLRCARGGRPLIHVMRCWSIVAPHFVEAACHRDSLISKKGVTTIHDIVSALLASNSELPHFHFNEALFKPFENLLCLELCDTDIQEQVVSSICEFVEGCTTEIRSGWRPLFGALRAVHIPNSISDSMESGIDKVHHLRVVLDVFEAFLGTDNMFVFAYAAVDCLLCLLKHVKGPAELQESTEMDAFNCHGIPLDMCLAALKYLEKCSFILSSMYKIPTCPVFHSANRIQLYSEPCVVDPTIPGMQVVYFDDPDAFSYEISNANMLTDIEPLNIPVTLSSLDKHTGIIHVWFLLLEGLAGALATCPKRYQSHTIESLFSMLQGLKEIPGPEFGMYCINHLLLPMLQNWLRRTTKIYRGWVNFATNFKQCCGLATDLIVDYVQFMSGTSTLSRESGVHLMVQQLFLVLTECVSQPMEIISRLGCACIRHTIMSAGAFLTSELWDIVCTNLRRVCMVSLYSIKQLMMCFHVNSDNFYGDIGEVKVAARRDCSIQESERLRHLSSQVFLLDIQQTSNVVLKSTCIEDDELSYTFLLFPPNFSPEDLDASIVRVPFCSLVVGLLSHQILLQAIGSMLLQGTKYMLPTLVTLLPTQSSSKPGFLSILSKKQLQMLLGCLQDSYETACNFDLRPGLKFLVQKVAHTSVAANLYKQAAVSCTIHMLVLFELCVSDQISLEFVKNQIYDKKSSESPNLSLNTFLLLQEKFRDLCESYTEHVVEKDSSISDNISKQPIFFLAAPTDEIADFIMHQSDCTKTSSEICCDSSDSDDPLNEPHEKIYTIATEHTVNNMIIEYKKRKTQHSMPSRLKESCGSSNNSIPEDIVLQRRNSILKDGEAHIQVFKQLIQSFLDLHQSLDSEKFKAFLPVFFSGMQYLVAYASDSELKLLISEWLQRLAVCCYILPVGRTV